MMNRQYLSAFIVCLFLLFVTNFIYAQSRTVNVMEAEYYWDIDPGVGNGNAMTASDGNFNEAIEAITTNFAASASVGEHIFGIRVLGSDGVWSPTFSIVIQIKDDIAAPFAGRNLSVSQAEYYWDTDPGVGNGSPMLALDGNFDNVIEEVTTNFIANASVGVHSFNIRILGSDGVWSPTFSTVIQVKDDVAAPFAGRNLSVSQAEYYWDTDPGVGNGSPMLALDGNFDDAIEEITSNFIASASVGVHSFNIRVLGSDGVWSPTFSTVIQVKDDIAAPFAGRNLSVSQAEYYWDIDPGQGNGSLMLALDGNFNDAIEDIVSNSISTNTISLGLHTFNLRVLGEDGVWSPIFTTVVDIDTSLVPIIDTIVGNIAFCGNATLTGMVYNASMTPSAASYNWNIIGGTIVSGQNTASITIDWDANASNHILELQACNADGCGNTYTLPISITNNVVATIIPTGNTTFCAGDSVILMANSGFNYNWSNGATTSSITAYNSGNYSVTISDVNGNCTDNTSITIVANPLPNVSANTTESHYCTGSNPIVLTGTGASTYSWSNGIVNGVGFAPTSTQIYTVTGTDANGCTATDDISISVSNPPVIVATANATTICEGETVILNGTGASTYSWDNGVINGVGFMPTSNQIYTVTGTDGNGCTATDQVTIIVNPAPQATFTTLLDSVCLNDTIIALSATPTGGIFLGNGVVGSGFNPSIAGIGNHSITYSVTDGNGCEGSENMDIVVYQCPLIDAVYNVENQLSWNIYPNPTSHLVLIDIADINNVNSVRLYSSIGEFIDEIPLGQVLPVEYDLINLPSGIYLIKLEDKNGYISTKSLIKI